MKMGNRIFALIPIDELPTAEEVGACETSGGSTDYLNSAFNGGKATLSVSMSDALKAKVKAKAVQAKITMSEYVRALIEKDLGLGFDCGRCL